MRVRAAASIVLATLILVGTTSCNFISPQTTTDPYIPGEGYNFSFGEVKARNAILLSEDGDRASLIVTFVNDSDESQRVRVQYEGVTADGGTERLTQRIFVDDGVTIFDSSEDQTILLENVNNAVPGSLFPVYFQYGDEEGIEARIPVLDDTLETYDGLLPTPVPTAPEATTAPEPGATPDPIPAP